MENNEKWMEVDKVDKFGQKLKTYIQPDKIQKQLHFIQLCIKFDENWTNLRKWLKIHKVVKMDGN